MGDKREKEKSLRGEEYLSRFQAKRERERAQANQSHSINVKVDTDQLTCPHRRDFSFLREFFM